MNKDLVLNTLDLIEANLDRWDQDSFSDVSYLCGTTACFAGWALIGSGYTLDDRANFVDTLGRKLGQMYVESVAADLLKFTDQQVEDIFYWFPCDNMDNFVTTTKREEFETFKVNVLALTGIKEGE